MAVINFHIKQIKQIRTVQSILCSCNCLLRKTVCSSFSRQSASATLPHQNSKVLTCLSDIWPYPYLSFIVPLFLSIGCAGYVHCTDSEVYVVTQNCPPLRTIIIIIFYNNYNFSFFFFWWNYNFSCIISNTPFHYIIIIFYILHILSTINDVWKYNKKKIDNKVKCVFVFFNWNIEKKNVKIIK
jgi:hypothetical protein